MKKENFLSPFIEDYEECSSRYDEIITYIKNPENFAKVVKDNPELIFSDKIIKHVILVFRDVCKLGNPHESDYAKSILKKAAIPLFIPREARSRRSLTQYLRWFKQKDIDLNADYIHVGMSKSGKGRNIPINEMLRKVLQGLKSKFFVSNSVSTDKSASINNKQYHALKPADATASKVVGLAPMRVRLPPCPFIG